MADSFFGFDTSLSNLNDDEELGEPSEDEYDALNDETFGQAEELDWEQAHEQLAEHLESSRRYNTDADDADSRLEASLSQLVLDETDAPRREFNSVWRHDGPFSTAPTITTPLLKNVVSVEELERQLRQKQVQQKYNAAPNYMQPKYQPTQPVILQRPPGMQAPVPLPYAQQPMSSNMNLPLNKLMGQTNQMNQMSMQNHLGHMNQMGQNQYQNINQMGQNMNQFGQTMNQIGNFQNSIGGNNMMNQLQNSQNIQSYPMSQQNQIMQNKTNQGINQLSQNVNQIGKPMNQLGQNMGQGINQMGQNTNQMNQNFNQLGQNINQIGPNMNQMGPNMNQMSQNMNQMGPNNQIISNGQFATNLNQFPHMMGQPRMIAPPPGMNVPRQNFSNNMGQFNHNFRAPMQTDPLNQPMANQSMLHSTHLKNQSTPIKSQNTNSPKPVTQKPQMQNQKLQKRPSFSKNMTSQNLVQLIQTTHPMLQQYNNSFHNASHHPILNNRSNVFNNNQYNHPLLNNQRQNGVFSNNNMSMNGDDSSATSEDEYAGLMTQREKQWLINIQMLQLNTGTPYIHDFYYTVFLERQANKEKEGVKEAHKANQQNHPFYSGAVNKETSRERRNSNRHNSTSEDAPRTYVPTQFENSLGKLQCGSVTAPRKIIDLEVVSAEPASNNRTSRAPSVASTVPPEVPREMKRTKQLLLDIEALYLILLRLEELNDPLAIANALILKEREEKQKLLEAAQKEMENEEEDTNVFLRNIESVQRKPKQESPKSENIDKRQVVNLVVTPKPAPAKNLLDENKDELINKLFAGILHGDRLQQIMTVRKGRTLLSRFASRIPPTHTYARAFWTRVLRCVHSASKRDDGCLHSLAPHFRKYIQSTNGWPPILECCSILAEAMDPARTRPYCLTSAFTLSCICALIEKGAHLVTTPEATSNERQWYKFLKTVARALKTTNLVVARPVIPLPEGRLSQHLKLLESRSTVEILQRGKTTVDFADLTKHDVYEYLIKHLC